MSRRKDDWDDGRVIAPMDNVGSSFGRSGRTERTKRSDVTKKERRAIVRAMFAVLLPRFVIVLCSFAVVAILCYLWLSGGV